MARASQQESVSVVIRATDARDTIADTVASALRLADARLRPEIVLVHDCSRDGTWSRLLDLKGDHPELHLIDLGSQYGSGLALVEGVRRSRGERVCVVAPGADADTLARAVHEARRREAVLASLEESLGDTARERLKRPLFAQAFGPGVVLHVDRPQPAGRAAEPHTHAAGRRRTRLVVPLAGALAAAGVALVLTHGSADEAPPPRSAGEAAPVASPVATLEPDAPVLVAAEVPVRLGPGAQPRPRTERPLAADSAADDTRARVASGGAASGGAAPAAPADGADGGVSEPMAPASGGHDAGASTPPTVPQPPAGEHAAPADSSAPAGPPADPVPPLSDEEPPASESGGVPPAAEQPPEPPPAVTPPPESPSAGPVPSAPAPTPSAPPSPGGEEPAPTGPGNGNGQGNGHAYGQGNGNGNGGNGNGNANGHNKD